MDAEVVDSHAKTSTVEGPTDAASGSTVDFSFYSTFWTLQKAFSEPIKAMKDEGWSGLSAQIESVLQVFSAFPQHTETSDGAASGEAAPGEGGGKEAMEVEEADTLREVYFAKFLTSSKLMNLQLRDSYFRRHVLVQMLIFLQVGT